MADDEAATEEVQRPDVWVLLEIECNELWLQQQQKV